MQFLDPEQFGDRDAAGLAAFLGLCLKASVERGEAVLGSISLRVPELDPLAVLQSIHEPEEDHLFLEKVSDEFAIAGAEVAEGVDLVGGDRFVTAASWVEGIRGRCYLTGDRIDGWEGPVILVAAPFAATSETVGRIWIPRWQVVRTGGLCIATATVRIGPDTDLRAEAERIWRAHQRFGAFEYGEGGVIGRIELASCIREEITGGTQFGARVAAAVAAIRAGQFDKVVLSRALRFRHRQAFDPMAVVHRLRMAYPSCYAFSLATRAGESWVGASPERLVSVEGGRFRTEAIAGSIRRGATAGEDAALGRALLDSGKDRREHAHVIAAIRRRLAGLGVTRIEEGAIRVLRLANVQHLKTPLAGVVPESGLLGLAAVLHPTPAVGGTPRGPALEHIAAVEPFDRGHFTGFFGYLRMNGDGELAVALRCARMRGTEAVLFAGAGLVEDSDPDAETAETDVKFNAMLEALG